MLHSPELILARVLTVPVGGTVPAFVAERVEHVFAAVWPLPWKGRHANIDEFRNYWSWCNATAALAAPTATGLRHRLERGELRECPPMPPAIAVASHSVLHATGTYADINRLRGVRVPAFDEIDYHGRPAHQTGTSASSVEPDASRT